MYRNGQGVPRNHVVAYALYNLSVANGSSTESKAFANRAELAKSMSAKAIEAAQSLSNEIAKPGNLVKALDAYVKNPAIREAPVAANRNTGVKPAPADNGAYPARPAKQPGVVRCNTRCNNADCWRTYDDDQKVRFQAKRVFDGFSGEWKFDSGSC